MKGGYLNCSVLWSQPEQRLTALKSVVINKVKLLCIDSMRVYSIMMTLSLPFLSKKVERCILVVVLQG